MDKKAGWIFAIIVILFIVAPATAQSSIVGTVIEDGVRKITFEVPAGKLKVFLPDDMAAGDTISGTVTTEPNGKDAKEKSKNQLVLAGYVFDLGDGTTIKADQPRFTWVPQAPSAPTKPKYEIRLLEVLAKNGKTVAVASSGPIMPEPLNPAKKSNLPINGPIIPEPVNGSIKPKIPINGPIIPEPVNGSIMPKTPINGPIIPEPVNGPSAPRYTIQPLGQTGRNVIITGPFDGNSSNTGVTIGGGSVTILAESPRKAIFTSPSNVVGATEIKVNDGATQTTGAFRNLKIDLTAPKTSLLKGESTELHMQISGLDGITTPIPVQIVTTGSVNTQGGNTQTINIQPSQVTPGGTFSQTLGLTGTSAGGFAVTATVIVPPRP